MTSSASNKKSLSLRKKVLFAMLTTSLFFLLFEGTLRLLGLQPILVAEDPYVGFSSHIPLFEPAGQDENGVEIVRTAKNKLVWFNEQSFAKTKPKGTTRVFCMGGSTTYGHPYWDSTSFSRWLREYLPLVDKSTNWEVINAGGISYASYRVANLMEELREYQPDLFVVYSVHNEFLERRTYREMFDRPRWTTQWGSILARTSTYAITKRVMDRFRHGSVRRIENPIGKSALPQEKSNTHSTVLPGEVDEILNHTVGPVDYHRDLEWRAQVLMHYETNLNRMVEIARSCGARILFVTPTSNEKNCSPFKSEWNHSFSSQEKRKLQESLIAADQLLAELKHGEALEKIDEILVSDPHHADTLYRKGRVLFSQKNFVEAKKVFRQALNEDICPLRALDEIRPILLRVASNHYLPIVDFEEKLRQLSISENGHDLFGDEYFLDHVHPTIEVHRRLALWIIEVMQENGWIDRSNLADKNLESSFEKVRERVLSEIDQRSEGIALRNLAKVLHWGGKFEEAEPRARDAMELLPNDPESRFVLAGCLRHTGRGEEALKEYERLFAEGAEYPRAYQPLGEMLAERGRLEQARAYLLLAVLRSPTNAGALTSLGIVHFQLKEYAFAEESLAESNRLYPDDPQTLFFLAKSRSALGKHEEALSLFKVLESKGIRDAALHYHFGLALEEAGERESAKEEWKKALEIDPLHQDALKKLGLESMGEGR